MKYTRPYLLVTSGSWIVVSKMNEIKDYTDLIVWQKSMDLVETVYKVVRLLPKEEVFALSSQLRRAVVSVPSNIAEGQQRKSTKEFINFLSKQEVQMQRCKLSYLFVCG